MRFLAGHLSSGLGAEDRGARRGFSLFPSLLEGVRARFPGNFGFPEEFAHRGKIRIPFRSGISCSETNFPQPRTVKGFDSVSGGNPDIRKNGYSQKSSSKLTNVRNFFRSEKAEDFCWVFFWPGFPAPSPEIRQKRVPSGSCLLASVVMGDCLILGLVFVESSFSWLAYFLCRCYPMGPPLLSWNIF